MDRTKIKLSTHCQAEALTLKNPVYKKWVIQCTEEEMKKDFGVGDLTVNAVLKPGTMTDAFVVAKESGVFAGRQEVECFLSDKGIAVKFLKKDGDLLKKGDVVLRLGGDAGVLMKVERIVLNLIGRMSGVSTLTKKTVDKAKKYNKNILVTPTRKTLLGLLDKRACVLGGGGTHRLGLDNAILIKHNHIKASGMPITKVLTAALGSGATKSAKFIEIEVKNRNDALKVAKIFAQAKAEISCFLMFDNMSPREISDAISQMKRDGTYNSVLLEASGRINLENIGAYAKTGVDIVSLGSLTHSASMLDFSMRIH